MSTNTAVSPNACYKIPELFGLGEEVLGRPSRDVFAANLNHLLRRRGAATALAAFAELEPSQITRLRKGQQTPNFEQLDKIAEFFKIPVSRLYVDITDPEAESVSAEEAYRILGARLNIE